MERRFSKENITDTKIRGPHEDYNTENLLMVVITTLRLFMFLLQKVNTRT